MIVALVHLLGLVAANDEAHWLIKGRIPAETCAFTVINHWNLNQLVKTNQVTGINPLVNHNRAIGHSDCKQQAVVLRCKPDIGRRVLHDKIGFFMPRNLFCRIVFIRYTKIRTISIFCISRKTKTY